MLYLIVKWLHIVAVISWMAGILYLYRLLIYQAERGPQSQEIHALLALMSQRLYRYITVPAMSVATLAGLGMVALSPALVRAGWFHAKFTLVLGLIAATIYAGRLVVRAAVRAQNLPASKTLRLLNEVPTLLMLVIVGLVVLKPF